MGTNTKTKQDNSTVPQITVTNNLLRRIDVVFRELELEVVDRRALHANVSVLAEALNRFADNRKRWDDTTDPYDTANQILLQKHLMFTLAVPAGRADNARKGIDTVTGIGLFPWFRGRWSRAALASTIRPYVRFPNQKAERIVKALDGWDRTVKRVCMYLKTGRDVSELRTMLMGTVDGFANKAASHFMRNTGLMAGWDALPIIDTHILKALDKLGYGCAGYRSAEMAFTKVATMASIPPLLLDSVLWCAYAGNFDIGRSDFDNFDTKNSEQ